MVKFNINGYGDNVRVVKVMKEMQYEVIDQLIHTNEFELIRIKINDSNEIKLMKKYKTYHNERSTIEMNYSIQEEVRVMKGLNGKGVLRPFYEQMEENDRRIFFLNEEGEMLQHYLLNEQPSLKLNELLSIAIGVVECVQHLHQANYLLRYVSASYFMISNSFNAAKLIDLRYVLSNQTEKIVPTQMPLSEDVMQYMSPELANRSNLHLDERSDIYSIGVLLYELIVGQHPYAHMQQVDSRYQHLAAVPLQPDVINDKVPSALSRILLKCLEKNPENRYSTINGLVGDLKKCLRQLENFGEIFDFSLADVPPADKMNLTDALFERSAEKRLLSNALTLSEEGTSQFIIVSGPTGIGKTKFVHNKLSNKIFENHFILHLSATYHASQTTFHILFQGIEKFIDFVLMNDYQQLIFWREKLLAAMSGYGQLLIQKVPKLKLILGNQPDVADLPLLEAQTRIRILLARFYQVVIMHSEKMIIFIDDIQWADKSSIEIVFELVQDFRDFPMALICTYNEEEMTILHPFLREVNRLKKDELEPVSIQLHSFTLNQIYQEFVGLVERDGTEVKELARVLFEKTEGKPYALNLFVKELVAQRTIFFDEFHLCWRWNIQLIKDAVAPHLTAQARLQTLYNLPKVYIEYIGCASYIGELFSLEMVAAICGAPMEEVQNWAENMVQFRLIQPKVGQANVYRFQHEDIFKASKTFILDEDVKKILVQCGTYYFNKLNEGENIEPESIISYWNQAIAEVVAHGWKAELAQFNYNVALHHLDLLSFTTASYYLKIAVNLLGEEGWKEQYGLTLQAYLYLAETEFLKTNFDEAKRLFNAALHHATNPIERAKIYNSLLKIELSLDKYSHAIEYGKEALDCLEIPISLRASKWQIIKQLYTIQQKLKKVPIDKIQKLPPTKDERTLLAMEVLANLSDPIYSESIEGWFNTNLIMLDMTLEHGMNENAAHAFVSYALVLTWHYKRYKEAYEWGKLACEVSKENPTIYNRVYTIFLQCIDSWRQFEPNFLLTYADYASESALLSGDIWRANQNILTTCALMFQFGHPLPDIYRRLLDFVPNFLHDEMNMHNKQATILSRMLVSLTKKPSPKDPFLDVVIDAHAFFEGTKGDNSFFIKELVQIYLYITNYLYGNYKKAFQAIEECFAIVEQRVQNVLQQSSHYFYYVLTLKELYANASPDEQKRMLTSIKQKIKVVKKMAHKVPINYLHKYLVMEAECAALEGKNKKAEQFYERALSAAKTAGAIHDVGIIAECFAKYGLKTKNMFLARLYMNEAVEAFYQWGAYGKTEQLEKEYKHLLLPNFLNENRMDLVRVADFAQVLASETDLPTLLQKLMPIMLENAGATYGVLILGDEHNAVIETYGTVEKMQFEAIGLKDADNIVPKEMVSYVFRTKEHLYLNDVHDHELFRRLPYFEKSTSKAVICHPIIVQNKLIGAFYFENHLYSGVFTKDRISVINILSSQCGISIANAYFIRNLELLNKRLEHEVEKHGMKIEHALNTKGVSVETFADVPHQLHLLQDNYSDKLVRLLAEVEEAIHLIPKSSDEATKKLCEIRASIQNNLHSTEFKKIESPTNEHVN